MKSAFRKDIFQTIKNSRRRFIAIMIITVLGVTMFSGLRAACNDLRKSADALFDQQHLHDLTIASTLGLTEDDVESLLQVDHVDKVNGIYSETVQVKANNKNCSLTMQTLSEDGIDTPYILEGRLPEKDNEVAVTQKFLEDTGFSIHDTFTVKKESDSVLTQTSFKITGVVVDVTSVDNPSSCTSFRSSNIKDNTVFVIKDVFDNDIYTSIVLTLDQSNSYFCYEDEYKSYVKEVKNNIEDTIKEDREDARYQQIYDKAYQKIYKEQQKTNRKLKKALQTLNDSQKEIDDGFVQINSALATLNENEANANAQFAQAEAQIEQNRTQIEDGLTQLEQAQEQLDQGKEALEQNAQMSCDEIKASYTALQASIEALQQQIDQTEDEVQKEILQAQLEAMQQQFAQMQVAYNSVLSLEENQKSLDENKLKLEQGLQQLESGEATLQQQKASAYLQIAQGKAEIQENLQTLNEGQSELDEGYATYEENKEKADKEFTKAYKKLEDLDTATWYIQDRSSLNGYNNISSDADSIEAIARVFPVVFFIVAILISLTTITRMVEEDRGLIGTYKALGFTNKEIRRKYLIYSLFACGAGCIIGTLLAFIALPEVLFIIFKTMYLLPFYSIHFIWLNGCLGPMIFLGGILLAAFIACRSELKQTPSVLMRPKSPRAGSRVLLERIPWIWKRLSFLNKVTIRNLFRYKKRMFMTIFGIAGCMALLLFGFGVKDSVNDLMPRQYDQTFKYDLMAVSGSDNDKLLSYVKDDKNVKSYVNVEMTSSTLIANGDELSVTLIVADNTDSLKDYIQFENIDNEIIDLEEGKVYITQNAANVLGFSAEDSVGLRLLDLQESQIKADTIIKNYLGNYVYMTKKTYKSYFNSYKPNAILLNFSDSCKDPVQYADDLALKDGVTTCLSTQNLKDQFSDSFMLIQMVVYVIIIMSAALAFVVLFTLSTTNISERERELATIKVLGFYDREVHLYVDKETMILTIIGIVLGIPLGRLFVSTLTIILNLPSIYLETSLYTISYIIAAGLSLLFAVIVSFIMDKTLDTINPVEALKSIE